MEKRDNMGRGKMFEGQTYRIIRAYSRYFAMFATFFLNLNQACFGVPKLDSHTHAASIFRLRAV